MGPAPATIEECGQPTATRWPVPAPGPRLEPLDPAELHAEIRAGTVAADLYEALLAQVARAHGALDLAIGEGLAAMCLGDRLIRLGFSCLGDYARELLGIRERTAEGMVPWLGHCGSGRFSARRYGRGRSRCAVPRRSCR